ncbi:IclR family transcriptional regulator [Galbitalea sp. SE-J8]|uniref:IclR family transcriptional regulator n=1 Tax=Galbitalea sp. SE-J8 TaxID=3054952 RepID=UPI00259C7AF8|nr:IclR family transcriptional regulator [Galbitalea sp. SE-J8]MDM4762796.1 IclR family transcriptional regulator [Galbitalea sp. SE-J8]
MSDLPEKDPAPALTRALRILDVLQQAEGMPLPLSELARAIGAAKSSTLNLCVVLESGGLIRRGDAGYTLGHRLVELGGAYVRTVDELGEFYRYCRHAPHLSHEVVQLAMLDGAEVVYLARATGRAPMRLMADIGDRFPAAPTALGNALLADLDPDEVARRFQDPATLPQRTPRSVRTPEALLEKLAGVRGRGYAVDDEEVHPGVTGIAVAIPPRSSSAPALAVGVSMLTATVDAARRSAVVRELHELVALMTNPLVPRWGAPDAG